MTTHPPSKDREIDYRPETPTTCPWEDCHAAVHITGEERGHWYISGPADLEATAKYDITTEGLATTIWNTYVCENGHAGPILLG